MKLGTMIRVSTNYAGICLSTSPIGEETRLSRGDAVIWLGSFRDFRGINCQIVVTPQGSCIYIPGLIPSDVGTVI